MPETTLLIERFEFHGKITGYSRVSTKTINKYLGSNYVVKSSVGHIRDLPTLDQQLRKPESRDFVERREGKAATDKPHGVDPEHRWKARYR